VPRRLGNFYLVGLFALGACTGALNAINLPKDVTSESPGDSPGDQQIISRPQIVQLYEATPNSRTSTVIDLVASISGAYDSYCIKINSDDVGTCNWIVGDYPGTVNTGGAIGAVEVRLWLRNKTLVSDPMLASFFRQTWSSENPNINLSVDLLTNEEASLVSLMIDGTQYCNGVLINEHYVLTAAVCVGGGGANTVELRYGSTDRSAPIDISVSSNVTSHPNFKNFFETASGVAENDLALIRVDPAILTIPDVIEFATIAGAHSQLTAVDSTLAVAGWVRPHWGTYSISIIARAESGVVISSAQWLDYSGLPTVSGLRSFFVGLDDSSCNSYWTIPGTPVFAYGNGGERYLVGVTQYSPEGICSAAVTDLSQYTDWISENSETMYFY
jgi:hypothetical protein